MLKLALYAQDTKFFYLMPNKIPVKDKFEGAVTVTGWATFPVCAVHLHTHICVWSNKSTIFVMTMLSYIYNAESGFRWVYYMALKLKHLGWETVHPVDNRSKVRDGAMTINVELASLSL